MKATETKLKGCFILEPTVFVDQRGYFLESYNQNTLAEILGFRPNFVQDNQSKSSFGVVRGLHMQQSEHAQAKLVSVLVGAVIDVALDARPDSPTYGQFVTVELSAENKKQLFIPKGFLHGFSVISEHAVFFYKCDDVYNKESEVCVNPMDSDLNIDWGISQGQLILSEKDTLAPSFSEFNKQKIKP